MPSGKGSSHRWRQRQSRDPYVDKAAKEGWRARAAYKLIEIDKRDRLLRPGMKIVDLGSAPGSWSQVCARRIGDKGRIFAIDLLPMDPVPGVEFLQGDFLSEEGLEWLRERAGEHQIDLVISDLAPNISGNRAVDQPRSIALVEEALLFAEAALKPGGAFLTKIFQGEGQRELELKLKQRFGRLKRLKPKASRPESREIYLLACNYRMV
jgi:23S rRNA (uridine2552-2'-O)-methyltransferase